MKNIFDIYNECNSALYVNPSNTVGMGNPMPATDTNCGSEPLCKCKKEKTKKRNKLKNISDIFEEPKVSESILGDLEDNLKAGDEMAENYKLAEKELDYLRNLCSDISNWNGYEFESVALTTKKSSGVRYEYQIFIKLKYLLKYFNLSGKNLFLSITFTPGTKDWVVSFITTNNIKTKKWKYKPFSGDTITQLKVNSIQQCIHFNYVENSFIQEEGSRSKYTPKQFIDKFIISKFKDMNTFKKEIIDEFKELESSRYFSKWCDKTYI